MRGSLQRKAKKGLVPGNHISWRASFGEHIFRERSRGGDGTRVVRIRFRTMVVSLSKLLEDSFQIAWEYLERTGELGGDAAASRFLSDTIETMIRRG
jgi:hypothetical protein